MTKPLLLFFIAGTISSNSVLAQEKHEVFLRYDDYAACLANHNRPATGLSNDEVWSLLTQAENQCNEEKLLYLSLFPSGVQETIEKRFREKKRALFLALTE